MTYDDDFDEEEIFQNRKTGAQGRFDFAAQQKEEKEEEGTDEDEILDDMAKFVEGQDLELVKDRSSLVEDDEKVKKNREKQIKEAS